MPTPIDAFNERNGPLIIVWPYASVNITFTYVEDNTLKTGSSSYDDSSLPVNGGHQPIFTPAGASQFSWYQYQDPESWTIATYSGGTNSVYSELAQEILDYTPGGDPIFVDTYIQPKFKIFMQAARPSIKFTFDLVFTPSDDPFNPVIIEPDQQITIDGQTYESVEYTIPIPEDYGTIGMINKKAFIPWVG